jgi:hypothetical protein
MMGSRFCYYSLFAFSVTSWLSWYTSEWVHNDGYVSFLCNDAVSIETMQSMMRWSMNMEQSVEWTGKGNRSTRRKPASVPLCPLQIPCDPAWVLTRATAVGCQRLTAWAMVRPYYSPEGKEQNHEEPYSIYTAPCPRLEIDDSRIQLRLESVRYPTLKQMSYVH